MKTLCTSLLLFAVGVILVAKFDRNETKDVENEIRKLDIEEADAILKKDTEALDRLTSEDFFVNSPRNKIVRGREVVKLLLFDGVINYKSFDRQIESVAIYGDTAVVMGHETVVNESGPNATSVTVKRRYTNIWLKRNGQWVLSARHASVICGP